MASSILERQRLCVLGVPIGRSSSYMVIMRKAAWLISADSRIGTGSRAGPKACSMMRWIMVWLGSLELNLEQIRRQKSYSTLMPASVSCWITCDSMDRNCTVEQKSGVVAASGTSRALAACMTASEMVPSAGGGSSRITS